MIELNQFFGEKNPVYSWIIDLTKLSLLGDKPDNRQFAIRALDDIFDNNLLGSFVGDNQLFLTVRTTSGTLEQLYVCDLPKEYGDKPIVVHGYNIRS